MGLPFSSVGIGGTEAGLPPMGTQVPTAEVVPIRDGRISFDECSGYVTD